MSDPWSVVVSFAVASLTAGRGSLPVTALARPSISVAHSTIVTQSSSYS